MKTTIRNMKAKPRHDEPGPKYGEQNHQGDQSVFKIKRPIIRSSSLRPSEMRTHLKQKYLRPILKQSIPQKESPGKKQWTTSYPNSKR